MSNYTSSGIDGTTDQRVKINGKRTGSKYDDVFPLAVAWMKENKRPAQSADLHFGMPKGTMYRLLQERDYD